MYAVIRTGGKQYKVAENDVLAVERLDGAAEGSLTFSEVLALHDGKEIKVGSPMIEGATVTADILEQGRAGKIVVFKKKRRKNYRRKAGHRQFETVVRITGILPDGKAKAGAKRSAPAEGKAEAEKPKETEVETPKDAEAEARAQTEAPKPAAAPKAKAPAPKKAEAKGAAKGGAKASVPKRKPAARKPAEGKD